ASPGSPRTRCRSRLEWSGRQPGRSVRDHAAALQALGRLLDDAVGRTKAEDVEHRQRQHHDIVGADDRGQRNERDPEPEVALDPLAQLRIVILGLDLALAPGTVTPHHGANASSEATEVAVTSNGKNCGTA